MRLSRAAEILKQFIEEEKLANPSDTFILAVSGGKDSMAMLEIFYSAGLRSVVAHMNFSLRGTESDDDASFVRQRCLELGIPCHIQKVDCRSYAADNGLNIQSSARELRYTWFQTLLTEASADLICTAHHQDDAVETLFINLIRGTGVRGLTGIPVKRGKIIRPMMCFDSEQINSIIKENGIGFREDSSNASTKYLRNKIRHQLVPMLDDLYLGSRKVLYDNIVRFRSHMDAFRALEASYMENVVTRDADQVIVDLEALWTVPAYDLLFARLGEKFGFSSIQCANLLDSDRIAGAQFKSHTHEMIRDRDRAIIRPLSTTPVGGTHRIALNDIDADHVTHCGQLDISEVVPPSKFEESDNVEYIDADKVTGDLTLRPWQPGDKISPLGMNGTQKVSDILTNQKYSLFEKERVYVLTSGEEVIWLVGIKPSGSYRITPETRRAYRLEWHPS